MYTVLAYRYIMSDLVSTTIPSPITDITAVVYFCPVEYDSCVQIRKLNTHS